MKFKLGDVIIYSDDNQIIAKIVDASEWNSSYRLLWLYGGLGWLDRYVVENYYEKIGWNKAFFNLFIK